MRGSHRRHPRTRHPRAKPMSAVLLAALLAAQPEPLRIDRVTITVDDARSLNGRRVKVSFVAGKPSYALNGVTVTGPADQENDGDDVSRGAILRGESIIDPG